MPNTSAHARVLHTDNQRALATEYQRAGACDRANQAALSSGIFGHKAGIDSGSLGFLVTKTGQTQISISTGLGQDANGFPIEGVSTQILNFVYPLLHPRIDLIVIAASESLADFNAVDISTNGGRSIVPQSIYQSAIWSSSVQNRQGTPDSSLDGHTQIPGDFAVGVRHGAQELPVPPTDAPLALWYVFVPTSGDISIVPASPAVADVRQFNPTVYTAGGGTPANTPNTGVSRDSSGNFAASIITATLNGNATTATNATNAANSANSALLNGFPSIPSTDATIATTSGVNKIIRANANGLYPATAIGSQTNLLINPNWQHSQKATGGVPSIATGAMTGNTAYFVYDQWFLYSTATGASATAYNTGIQDTTIGNFRISAIVDAGIVIDNNSLFFLQNIVAPAKFIGKTFTFAVNLRAYDFTSGDNLLSPGVTITAQIASNGTPTTSTATFTSTDDGRTDAGAKTLIVSAVHTGGTLQVGININLAAVGSNRSIRLVCNQSVFNEGIEPTPFSYRDYELELRDCQPYIQKFPNLFPQGFALATSTYGRNGEVDLYVPFPPMVRTPTIILPGAVNFNVTNVTTGVANQFTTTPTYDVARTNNRGVLITVPNTSTFDGWIQLDDSVYGSGLPLILDAQV